MNPQTFNLAGSAMANVRTSCRRAERDGVVIHWYNGVPPAEVMHQLEQLSSAWLERKAGKHASEMGFSMGRLNELIDTAEHAGSVAEMPVAPRNNFPIAIPRLVTGVAVDNEGKACAFVTFTPIYGSPALQSADNGSERVRGWGGARFDAQVP